jgi:hypothetical protein
VTKENAEEPEDAEVAQRSLERAESYEFVSSRKGRQRQRQRQIQGSLRSRWSIEMTEVRGSWDYDDGVGEIEFQEKV